MTRVGQPHGEQSTGTRPAGAPSVLPDIALHIALLAPEIPGNTGNIGRLCVGIGAHLHLIHPLGFSTGQKAVRRAGIDHWSQVQLTEHQDEAAFFDWLGERPLHLLSAQGALPHTKLPASAGCVLLFGCESKGLPARLVERHGAYRIPSPGSVRSLNLSNAVAVVAYQALQAIDPELF